MFVECFLSKDTHYGGRPVTTLHSAWVKFSPLLLHSFKRKGAGSQLNQYFKVMAVVNDEVIY